jgi:hypothetical protein
MTINHLIAIGIHLGGIDRQHFSMIGGIVGTPLS